jgi:hypothetical protein
MSGDDVVAAEDGIAALETSRMPRTADPNPFIILELPEYLCDMGAIHRQLSSDLLARFGSSSPSQYPACPHIKHLYIGLRSELAATLQRPA